MHVETIEVKIGDIWMTPEEPFQEVKQAVDLSKAEVIVAIGRGIKGKENIALAEKLAEVLGGDVCGVATNLRRRVVTDLTDK